MPRIQKLRDRCFDRQGGRCYYCQQPMWLADPGAFARIHGLSSAQTARLQASAEHLIARSDGGKDSEVNVVAACVFCNRQRHSHRTRAAPTPLVYRLAAFVISVVWRASISALPLFADIRLGPLEARAGDIAFGRGRWLFR